MQGAKAQSWSNMLWGLAKLNIYDTVFIEYAAGQAARQQDDTRAQGASNSLWALSKLRWRDDAVYAALLKQMASSKWPLNAHDISNALYKLLLGRRHAATTASSTCHW